MNFSQTLKIISIIIFTFLYTSGGCQINDKLKSLNDSISFENYISNPDYPTMIQSIEYDFSISNDSLLIRYTKFSDNLKYDDNKRTETHEGKMAIKDLKVFKVKSVLTEDEYYSHRYTKLIIETQRLQRVIEKSNHIIKIVHQQISMYRSQSTKTQYSFKRSSSS